MNKVHTRGDKVHGYECTLRVNKVTPNNNRYNNIDNNKDKGVSVSSVPLTKEQLRTKQFEENIKQVEFPQSVEELPKTQRVGNPLYEENK